MTETPLNFAYVAYHMESPGARSMLWWTAEIDRFEQEREAEQRGGEPPANPGRYGRQLAEWLADELQARAWDVHDLFCEDWGWRFELSRHGCRLHVHCGNEDRSTTRWRVGSEARPSLMQRMCRKSDANALAKSLDADMEAALRSGTDVTRD